jgi:hypothetical protein
MPLLLERPGCHLLELINPSRTRSFASDGHNPIQGLKRYFSGANPNPEERHVKGTPYRSIPGRHGA